MKYRLYKFPSGFYAICPALRLSGMKRLFYLIPVLLSFGCNATPPPAPRPQAAAYDTQTRTIHVFVALCDNKYQGIVPVPAAIGNGQDPNRNLYWGCGMGIRTYFKNSKEWKLVAKRGKQGNILERLVFKHRTKNYYLVADAYDGQYIRQCTDEFLKSTAGQMKDTLRLNNTVIGINGNARLTAYTGHDGLMDFSLSGNYSNADGMKRDCIILACYSRKYFSPHVAATKANMLVWTTGLMCPEAYSLHDALNGYIADEQPEQVRQRAVAAYARYQKCSIKAAGNLLVGR